jgi:lipopolysaccharide transport system permease protein
MADEELPLTIIEPPHGWQWLNVRELWAHRELLYFFTWRDVKVRYKQTALGAAWAILQPLAMATIFSLVLGQGQEAAESSVPYPVYVFSGLIAWTLFATSLGTAANSLIESERLITKIYFPRLLIPVAALGPALVDFCVASLVLAAMFAWYLVVPAWTIVFAPLALVTLLAAVIGAGSLLAALNVAYRDFRYTTTFLLQAWMFATPAIYVASFALPTSENKLTADWSNASTWFVLANPLNGCIAFFRASLLGLPLPWDLLGASAVVATAMLLIGLAYFRRVEDSFADVI